ASSLKRGPICKIGVRMGIGELLNPLRRRNRVNDDGSGTSSSQGFLKCPFCSGSTIAMRKKMSDETIYQAQCRNCGALGPVEDSSHDARTSWNVRGGAASEL